MCGTGTPRRGTPRVRELPSGPPELIGHRQRPGAERGPRVLRHLAPVAASESCKERWSALPSSRAGGRHAEDAPSPPTTPPSSTVSTPQAKRPERVLSNKIAAARVTRGAFLPISATNSCAGEPAVSSDTQAPRGALREPSDRSHWPVPARSTSSWNQFRTTVSSVVADAPPPVPAWPMARKRCPSAATS